MSQSQIYHREGFNFSNQARARADQDKAIARFESLADAALGKQRHAPGGCRQDQSTVSVRPAPNGEFAWLGPGAADPDVERLRQQRLARFWGRVAARKPAPA